MKANKFDINTNLKLFYKRYLILRNPITRLTNKEIDTLAEILYQHNIISSKFKDRNDPLKWGQIFSPEIKAEMAKSSNQSRQIFANNLSSLRKKGIIEDNKIADKYLVIPEKEFQLIFNFKIKDNE